MKSILVVDDDRDIVLGLSIRLRAAGYAVLAVQDGNAALSTAINKKPDLILMDIGIPAGNGLWVLEFLKKNANSMLIPVVIMTGMEPVAAREKAMALGAVEFFQKPVDNDQLLQAIRRHVGE